MRYRQHQHALRVLAPARPVRALFLDQRQDGIAFSNGTAQQNNHLFQPGQTEESHRCTFAVLYLDRELREQPFHHQLSTQRRRDGTDNYPVTNSRLLCGYWNLVILVGNLEFLVKFDHRISNGGVQPQYQSLVQNRRRVPRQ